jgi:tRNA dimethylallyltransferase
MQTPGLHAQLPAMRCVGYRQAWQLLAEQDAWSAQIQTQWLELTAVATRQLAKRQLTWLRNMPTRHVVHADAPDVAEQLLALATTLWGSHHA